MTTALIYKIQQELESIEKDLLDKIEQIEREFDKRQLVAVNPQACEFNDQRKLQVTRAMSVELIEVQSALHKIEIGTFGLCEVCGEEIEENRLLASPYTRFCLACG